MKKFFTNLLLAILLYGFTSATPTCSISLIKATTITKTYVSANYEIPAQKVAEVEIHPLDILALRFH
jgi:hypothetical protein